ncbi:MAG: protein translocase subunit SecF [Mariprofundaceae bacterium]|nr:protein translocase subunit SecF [Mariprofundaceae bacterium]
MQLIRTDLNIDFLGKRKIALAFSAVLLIIAIISLIPSVRGLNFGIDFTGGTLVQMHFKETTKVADIRTSLKTVGYEKSMIQTFGNDNEILVRVQNRENEKSSDISSSILEAVQTTFGKDNVEMRRVEFVGPQVGEELTQSGIYAVLWSMIAILLYVTFRFQFRYALGANAALFHDVTLVMGVFAITGKEFTLPIIAAVLTVIGYSLNDTIVVFDRIRENLDANKRRKTQLTELDVVNSSINQTLSRTLMTSLTTMLVVVALFLLGGEILKDFAFALIVGILVGTYSSIFVASPVMLSLEGRFQSNSEEIRKAVESQP